MSTREESTQEYGVLAGISMFHGQSMPKTNSNSGEKASPSNSMKNTNAASSSSSPSQPRPVGSNRFVCLSISNSNIYSFIFH